MTQQKIETIKGHAMSKNKRLIVAELNPHLVCALCGGYYVDATTVIECLHTFCKSCIVRYLETSKFCPTCDVLVHKTKPLLSIRPDKSLQNIVYKLVPGLYKDEMKRRRKFYLENDEVKPTSEEDGGCHLNSEYLLPGDLVSIAMKPLPSQSEDQTDCNASHTRFFNCPAGVTMAQLKRLLRGKFSLPRNHPVQFSAYKEDVLQDNITLIDVAYIKSWKKDLPLILYYKIYFTKKIKLDPLLEERAIKLEAEPSPLSEDYSMPQLEPETENLWLPESEDRVLPKLSPIADILPLSTPDSLPKDPPLLTCAQEPFRTDCSLSLTCSQSSTSRDNITLGSGLVPPNLSVQKSLKDPLITISTTTTFTKDPVSASVQVFPPQIPQPLSVLDPPRIVSPLDFSTQNEGVVKMPPTYSVPKSTTSVTSFKTIIPAPVRPVPEVMNFSSLAIPTIDSLGTRDCSYSYRIGLLTPPNGNVPSLFPGSIVDPTKLGGAVLPFGLTFGPGLICAPPPVNNLNVSFPSPDQSSISSLNGLTIQPFLSSTESNPSNIILPYSNLETSVVHSMPSQPISSILQSEPTKLGSSGISPSKGSKKPKLIRPKKNEAKPSLEEKEVQLMISETGVMIVSGEGDKTSNQGLINPVYSEANELLTKIESGSLLSSEPYSEDSKESDISDGAEKLAQIKQEISSILNNLSNDHQCSAVVPEPESISGNLSVSSSTSLNISENQNVALSSCASNSKEEPLLMVYTQSSSTSECPPDKFKTSIDDKMAETESKNKVENVLMNVNNSALQTKSKFKSGGEPLEKKKEDILPKEVSPSSSHPEPHSIKKPSNAACTDEKTPSGKDQPKKRPSKKYPQPMGYKTLKFSPRGWNPTISREKIQKKLNSSIPLKPSKFFKARNSAILSNAIKSEQSDAAVSESSKSPPAQTTSKGSNQPSQLTSTPVSEISQKIDYSHQTNNILKNKDAQKSLSHTSTSPPNKRNQAKETSEIRLSDSSSKTVGKEWNGGHSQIPKGSVARTIPDARYHAIYKERSKPESEEKGESKERNTPSTKRILNDSDLGAPNPKRLGNRSLDDSLQGETCKQELPKLKEGKSSQAQDCDKTTALCSTSNEQKLSDKQSTKDDSKFCSGGLFSQAASKKSTPRKHQVLVAPSTSSPNPSTVTPSTTSDVTSLTSLGIVTSSDSLARCVSTSPLNSSVSASSNVACSKPSAVPDDKTISKVPTKTVPTTSTSISQLTTDKPPSTLSGSVSRLIPKQSSQSPAKKQNTEVVMAASVKCKELQSQDALKSASIDKVVTETRGPRSFRSTGSGNNNKSKIVDESMSNNCQSVSKVISQALPEDLKKNSKSAFSSTSNASLPISKLAEVSNKIKNSPTCVNKVDQPSLNIKADSGSLFSKDVSTPSLVSTQGSSKIHENPQITPQAINFLEQQIPKSPCSSKTPTRTSITVDQLVPKLNFSSGRQDTNFDVKLSTSSMTNSNVTASSNKNQPLETVPKKQNTIPSSSDKLHDKSSSNLSSINPVSNNSKSNVLKDTESSLGDKKSPSPSDSSTHLVKGNKPDTQQEACSGPVSNKVCSTPSTPTGNNKEETSPPFKPSKPISSNDKENNNDRNKNNNEIKVDQRNKNSKQSEFPSTHSSASVSQSTKTPSSSISPILNNRNPKVTLESSTKSSVANSSTVNCPTSRPNLLNSGSVVNNLSSANFVPSSNSTPSSKSPQEPKPHPHSKTSSSSLKEAHPIPPVSAKDNASSVQSRSNHILTTQTSPKSSSTLEGNIALSTVTSSSVSSLPSHFGNSETTSSSQNSNSDHINSFAVSSSSCSYNQSSKENILKPQTSCEQAVGLSMNASRAVANRKQPSVSTEPDKNSITNTSTVSSGIDTVSKVSYNDKSFSKPISDSQTTVSTNAKVNFNSNIGTTSQSKFSSNLTVTQNAQNTPNIPKSQSAEAAHSSPIMTSQNSHLENIPFPLHNNISSQCGDNFYFPNSIQNCSMPFFNNFMPFHNVPITNSNISSSNINSYASTTSCSSHLQSQNRGKATHESTKVTSSTPATSSSVSAPMESINSAPSASPCPSLNVPTLQDASKFIQNLLSPHSISNASLDHQKAGVKSSVEELDRFLLQTISSTVPEAKISDLFSSSLAESNESMKMNKIEKVSNTNSCPNLDATVKSNSQSVPSVSVPAAKDNMNCSSPQNSVHSMQSMSMTSKSIPTTSHGNPRESMSSSSESSMSFQNMLNDASPSFQRSAANSTEASHKVSPHVPVMPSQAYTTVGSTLASVESSYKPMYHQSLCCKHQTDSSNQIHGHPLQNPPKSANNHSIHQPLKGNEQHTQVSSSLGKKPELTDKRTMAIAASSAPTTYGSYSDVNFNHSSTPAIPGESSMNKKAQRPSGYLGSNSITNPHQSSHQFPSFALNSMMNFHDGVAGISSPNLSNAHKHSTQATSWDSNSLNPFILNNSGEAYSASGVANKAGFTANANNCIQQNLFRNNNATGVKDQNLNSQSQTNFNASNICSPKNSTGLNAQYQTESNVKKNASNADYYENFSVGSQKYNASLYYSNYNNNYANFFTNSQGQGSPSLTSLVSGAGYNFPLSSSKFTSGQQYLNSSNNSYFSSGNFNVNCGTNYQNCINQPSTSNAGSSNMSSNLGNNFSGPLCNISLPYYSNCSFSYNSYPSYFCQGGDMSLLSPTASFIPPFSCLSPRPSLSSRNSSTSQSFNDFSLQSGFFPMVPFVSPLQGNGARATPSPVAGGIPSSFGARPFSTNYSQKTNEAGKGTHKTSQPPPKPGNGGGPSSKTKHKKTNAANKTKTLPTKEVESKSPRTGSLHPPYVNSDVATSSPSRAPQSLHASVPVSCTSGFGSNDTQRIGEGKTKGKEG